MFNQLIYIILFLLLLLFAPSTTAADVPQLLLSWILLLAGIIFQKKFIRSPKWIVHLVHIEILLYLVLAFYGLGLGALFKSQTLLAVTAISIYLSALTAHYLPDWKEVKLLVPFFLPFLFITLIFDLAEYLPIYMRLLAMLAASIMMMLFLPKLILYFWSCQKIDNPELLRELHQLTQRAGYMHAGFRIWNLLPHTLTAAIIGITASSRYILLTPALLRKLAPESIEAVVAHEIGHSQRHHLLLLPLILAGTFLPLWMLPDYAFSTLLIYGLFVVLYFRFLFGFFLRLFERQADLHGMKLGLPLDSMIDALNTIGIYSGNSHLEPSWHHHSLQERIDFLQKVQQNPSIAMDYHRKVSIYLGLYVTFFTGFLIFLYFN